MDPGVANRILKRLEENDLAFISELRTMIECVARRWNWSDAEALNDMTQESLLKLIANLRTGKFRGEASIKTYVYAIVRNTCIDHLKLERACEAVDATNVPLVDNNPLPDSALIGKDERRIACKVLLSLPDYCRRLWRLIFFGKRSYKEAGALLGVAEGTVKRKMWQCRQLAQEARKSFEAGEPPAR